MHRIPLLLLLLGTVLSAVEYTVSPADDLQAAINRLAPGDTLTLQPGEYHPPQTVQINACGTADQPIRIQGAERHLSLLTAWTHQEWVWQPVKDKPFVYQAEKIPVAVAVTELDTGTILRAAPSLTDMEYFRASFFHDPKKKILYLHCSDADSPSRHRIRVTTRSGYLLAVSNAEHLQIANLSFTGANHATPSESRFGSAIRVNTSNHILIENCDFYFNSGGIYITFHSRNPVVRNCFFRGNDGLGYGEMAQLFFHLSCSDCLAENNTVLDGRTHGIRFYSGAKNVTARGNIIRNERNGLYYKASQEARLAERNVVLDCLESNYSDLVGRPTRAIGNTAAQPSQMEHPGEDNLLFDPKFIDPLFCAPDHQDFRLQIDSPCLGRGAYPEPAPVFFVSPQGSDTASGRSVSQAWATLEQASKVLTAGDTVYLLPGEYEWHPLPDGVTLRGRSLEAPPTLPVVTLAGNRAVTLENLRLGELRLEHSEALHFKRITAGHLSAESCRNIDFFRCELQEISSSGTENARIIFSVLPAGAAAEFRQYYNGPAPVIGPGCHALPRGPHDYCRQKPQARIEDIAERVYADRALITWSTPDCSSALWNVGGGWYAPRPIMSRLEYGPTPECGNSLPSFGEIFHSLTLKDLLPGQQYYYRIRIPEKIQSLTYTGSFQEEPARNHEFLGGACSALRTFVTPAADDFQPRTHLVDSSQSLTAISKTVRPGDTILLQPGVYQDTFRPLASGRAGLPITLKAAVPGTVIMDGSANLRPAGVLLSGVEHITIQGLIFRFFSNKLFGYRAGMYYGQIQIYDSADISIRDCVFLGHGTYQFLIEMRASDRIRIENNVFVNGVNQINGGLNRDIEIIGNTFYYPLIRNILLSYGEKNSTVTVKKNLFLGKSRQKTLEAITYGEISGPENILFDDNIWFFSPQDPYRFCGFENLLALPPDQRGQPAGLERLRDKTGFEQNGRVIESFRLQNQDFIDPFCEGERYKKEFHQPVLDGTLVPTLEYFAPHPEIGLDSYGAHPR
ncbi:MAG: hypothetical protein GX564_13935 [Oligosphaeraceae bacterium]|nr:hypothetical protein [Oligosphaeraceae bacterium]